MRDFMKGNFCFCIFGITIAVYSLCGLGLLNFVTATPMHKDSRTIGVEIRPNDGSNVKEDAASAWFKKHTGGEEPLTIFESRDHKTRSYVGTVMEAMEKNKKITTDDQTMPTVRLKSGRTVKGKKGVAGNKVLFRRIPKRGRIFSLSEIVLKDSDVNTQGVREGGSILAKVTSKKGRTRVEGQSVQGYLIFNVSSLVDWSTRRVRLLYVTSGGTRMPISQLNEPLLVTYENIDENPVLSKTRGRSERNIRFPVSRSSNGPQANIHCKRRDWLLNMSIFRYDWYLYPMQYNAGICSGECPTPLEAEVLNITNYSFIKHLYHAQTFFGDNRVPRACCTPIEYESQIIYYLNSNGEDVISSFPNMKVTSCGCR